MVYIAGHPALAFDIPENRVRKPGCNSGAVDVKSLIDSIYNGFLLAVPKSRRSREKRAIRRFGWTRIQDYMTPRRNLVVCLECGEWHEGHTICGQLRS